MIDISRKKHKSLISDEWLFIITVLAGVWLLIGFWTAWIMTIIIIYIYDKSDKEKEIKHRHQRLEDELRQIRNQLERNS